MAFKLSRDFEKKGQLDDLRGDLLNPCLCSTLQFDRAQFDRVISFCYTVLPCHACPILLQGH